MHLNMFRREIVNARVADSAKYPPEIRVGGEESRLDQRRMRDCIGNLARFLLGARLLNTYLDELCRAFTIAHDSLCEFTCDVGQRSRKSRVQRFVWPTRFDTEPRPLRSPQKNRSSTYRRQS